MSEFYSTISDILVIELNSKSLRCGLQ